MINDELNHLLLWHYSVLIGPVPFATFMQFLKSSRSGIRVINYLPTLEQIDAWDKVPFSLAKPGRA